MQVWQLRQNAFQADVCLPAGRIGTGLITVRKLAKRAKPFVAIDVLFNVALRNLKSQVVTKSVVKKIRAKSLTRAHYQ